MTCMMSTLEEISLWPVDGKDVVDDLHTGRAEPLPALEQDDATENAQGTLSSSEQLNRQRYSHVIYICNMTSLSYPQRLIAAMVDRRERRHAGELLDGRNRQLTTASKHVHAREE